MRRLITPLFIAALAIASCKKDNNNNNNPGGATIPDSNAVRYTVSGLTDVSLGKTDSAVLVLGIAHTGGNQEKITLSVTGLPANTTATFGTPSGIPGFGTTLTIKTKSANPGTYPFKVVGTSASDSIKTYDLNLVVKGTNSSPTIGCAAEIIGNFTREQECNSTNQTAPAKIDSTGVKDEVWFYNLGIYPKPCRATLDCDKKTIIIPSQSFDNIEISGWGSFNDPDNFAVNFMVSGTGFMQTCSVIYRR